jgi:hypothetical protein
MGTTRTQDLIAAALVGALAVTTAYAQNCSCEELNRRMLDRHAVEAAIWGMPTVSLDAMRQAYFRDGKAKYGDIIWWPKGNAWKNQSLTPNTSLRSHQMSPVWFMCRLMDRLRASRTMTW